MKEEFVYRGKKYLLANARAYEYKAGALILKSVMTRRHGD